MLKLDRPHAIKQLVATYKALKNEKDQRLSHWQNVLDYTIPYKSALTSPMQMSSRPYRRKYDGQGMLNAARFAGNLVTHCSPPNRRWFLLSPPAGSALAADRGYESYLGERTERLHLALAQTNADTELHNVYEDLTIGTACLAVKRDEDQAFTLSARPITEYAFMGDEKGVHTTFIERAFTAYEAAERFGVEKLPEAAREALARMADSAYTKASGYLNVTRPNRDYDPSAIRDDDWPFENIWIDLQDGRELQAGGVRRGRYIISRFWRPTGLDWGMGVSDMAYPWIRCLDKASEVVLRYAAKVMDPASIWPDDAAFHPMSTQPGAIIIGRMGPTDRGEPKYLEIKGNHQLTQFLFEYYASMVAQAYMGQIFQTLSDDRQKTATEVATVLQKDYDLAIPVFGRLRRELFAPLLRVCLELLTEFELGIHGWRYGGTPLPDYEYDLELISPLALAIKYTELRQASDLIQLNTQLAQIDQSVWDNYSLDEISRTIGDNMAVPTRWKRSITERRAIREARAKLLAEREALERAKLAGQAAQGLSRNVEPQAALRMLLGQENRGAA